MAAALSLAARVDALLARRPPPPVMPLPARQLVRLHGGASCS